MWQAIVGTLANKVGQGSNRKAQEAMLEEQAKADFLSRNTTDRMGVLEKRRLQQEQLANVNANIGSAGDINGLIDSVFMKRQNNSMFGGFNGLSR